MMSLLQIGIILDIIGVILLFMDAIRTSSRVPPGGITFGFKDKYKKFHWRWSGRLGLLFLLAGFLLQFIYTL